MDIEFFHIPGGQIAHFVGGRIGGQFNGFDAAFHHDAVLYMAVFAMEVLRYQYFRPEAADLLRDGANDAVFPAPGVQYGCTVNLADV